MAKRPAPPAPTLAAIESIDLRAALEDRYLRYALSTIMGRALPDARDGLKPVHRRILYGMHLLRLDPAGAPRKSAKIVGDVMGDFHPHGDQAIYDALVRLAQDFASRYPLVDGQGNFGNVDGDPAAAYRYTEARMTAAGVALLEGIDEDAVDFRDNYSGEKQEPVVLPAAFPNLLANGAQGIAVGMATSVPPHEIGELCDAALYLIAHPNASAEALTKFVPGPDFPTGGLIVEPRDSILRTYETGRGAVRLRARWNREDGERGQWVAVVTEIPYGVPKSRLIEKLAELMEAKKLPLVADLRDESAKEVRVVVEPRSRNVDPATMMETLFRQSELEIRFPVNLNVLVDGVSPRVVSLGEALRQWLDHRRDVLLRRSRNRLAQIERRLELLEGMIVVFLNLDAVIKVIREADEPKPELMARFKLSAAQADHVLDTRLRSLRRLEEMALRKERDELSREGGETRELIGDEAKQWKTVAWQVREAKKAHAGKGGGRRTGFAEAPDAAEIDLAQALVEREPVTVVVSRNGWIRALKGHGLDLGNLAFKGDDRLKLAFEAETTSKLLALSTDGKAYTIDAGKLPGGRGAGEPIKLMADLAEGSDVVAVFPHVAGAKRLLVTTEGRGFVCPEDEMLSSTRKGRAVMGVDAPAELALAAPASGDHLAIVGQNRKLLVFPLADVPEMARGKGVRLQRFKDGGVADARTFKLADGLTWTDGAGRTFTVSKAELRDWIGARAEAGRLPPRGFPKSNKFG
ncbi:MAG: DNA topoisomerase IV subunit A [Hyphomicrobiales bacterium]|nr:DNA topoisomerase IV subunit A [Hyphomicrobiales bacterium]MDE2017269.1 DNA topoisomerase IV subunit A [Hyphomicrobiales bacterium]